MTVQQLIAVTEGDADGGAEKAVMIVSIRDVWPIGQNILTTASLFLECTLLAHKTVALWELFIHNGLNHLQH